MLDGADQSEQCADATTESTDDAYPYVLVKGGGIAGGEDLARVGNKLWSASESGSRYFHNRCDVQTFPGCWNHYFPYVYDIMIPEAFGTAPPAPQGDPVNSRHAKNVTNILTDNYAGWYDNSDRIRVMDVNGDQHDDIVIGPYSQNGCWYVLEGQGNPGNGQFIDRGCVIQAYAGWYDSSERLWVMDVNGDQHDDIVIGPYSQDGCWYVLQGGADAVGAAEFIDRGCQAQYKENWHDKAERIRPMDVNGDGADDIVIGPSSDGNWYLLEGIVSQTTATFQAGRLLADISPSYGGWWNDAERIKVLDANGDDHDDIVIGPYSQDGCWYILQGDASDGGAANFIDQGCVEQAYDGWFDDSDRFFIADFNGDQRDDIVIGPYSQDGCWYLLQGLELQANPDEEKQASLSDAGGCILHTDYHNWSNASARIRVMQALPGAPASILLGPKQGQLGLGEWQLLQGTPENELLNKQWAVNTMENWGTKAERIWIMDINGDKADDVVIGPSSHGNWYLIEGNPLAYVPEPSGLALHLSALCALAGLAWVRRSCA